MLGELLVFAVVLVILQAIMGLVITFIIMKLMTNKKFLKKYLSTVREVTIEALEE